MTSRPSMSTTVCDRDPQPKPTSSPRRQLASERPSVAPCHGRHRAGSRSARPRRRVTRCFPRSVDRAHRRRPGRDHPAQPSPRRRASTDSGHGPRPAAAARAAPNRDPCAVRVASTLRSSTIPATPTRDPAQPRPPRAAAAARCHRRARRRADPRPPGATARRRGRGARRSRRHARPDRRARVLAAAPAALARRRSAAWLRCEQ